ncbi:MAG TPA: anthranilate phosphoribosyltransferase [Planctomycetaceae bacterium]|nr:anthranilate phosphoribosyltransferase [Planctomycetaceae bacterium]
MADAIHNAIAILLRESSLTENEMHAAILQVMDGNASSVGLGMLLTALKLEGETVDEIVGAARAMRERVTAIESNRTGLLDTCGTGGDELQTFNISTATALVTAACGVPVAKHSNRSFSSRSGSADVLEALEVSVDLSPERVGRCIDEIGVGFCFAPLVHGAMQHAAPVRRQLGFRTIFNLLGPLTNPAAAEFQLLGAGRNALAEKLAGAAARLGTKRTLVVCGNDELDEVSLWGPSKVFRVEDGVIETSEWSAEELGLEECRAADLVVQSPAESAERIRRLLSGERGPARNIVLANTAAALVAAGRSQAPREGVKMGAEAIDSGAAVEVLRRLVDFTKK